MNRRLHRRGFIGRGVLGAAGLTILRDSRSAWSYQANEKLGVAIVGLGTRGSWFLETIPKLQSVVAICDVNNLKIADAVQRWERCSPRYAASSQESDRRAAIEFKRLTEQKPKAFHDFRKMLDEAGKGIDTMVVATPDHIHAVAAAAAIKAGKAVYCEKPLTRTVHESRALRELARKHKVPTAMGNQGTYTAAFRRALELIQGGVLGQIQEVHVWNEAGGADLKQPPQGEEPVPAHFQWDLWLGPAAARPYHPQWTLTYPWREFGTGRLGNWGSHSANLGFMAMKVQELWLHGQQPGERARPVIRVSARSSGINKISFPRWEIVRWKIPARAELPPITFTWYNGPAPGAAELIDPLVKDAPAKHNRNWRGAGTLIVGTKGAIHTTSHSQWFRLLPEERFQHIPREGPEIDGAHAAVDGFFRACRGGDSPWTSFDYGSALTEFLLLAAR